MGARKGETAREQFLSGGQVRPFARQDTESLEQISAAGNFRRIALLQTLIKDLLCLCQSVQVDPGDGRNRHGRDGQIRSIQMR